MRPILRYLLLIFTLVISSPVLAQSNPTNRVPLCLQFPSTNAMVPCTGVVPVDTATGNALNWSDLFSQINQSTSSTPANTASANATPVQNADGSKLATDTNLTAVKNSLQTLTAGTAGVPAASTLSIQNNNERLVLPLQSLSAVGQFTMTDLSTSATPFNVVSVDFVAGVNSFFSIRGRNDPSSPHLTAIAALTNNSPRSMDPA